MTTIIDNGFARISKETIVRNPGNAQALTGNDIAYDSITTVSEKISTLSTSGFETKEPSANKVTTMTGNTTSNVFFLTAKAVYDWATGLFAQKGTTNTFTAIQTFSSGFDLNSSDTTVTRSTAGIIAVEGVAVPTISSTHTLTNKRINKRVEVIASAATKSLDVNNYDILEIGVQSGALSITGFTGSPTNGQMFMVKIRSNSANAITWGATIVNGIDSLPTTTTVGKWTWVLLEYNSSDTLWYCISSKVQL